jgi:ABC-type transport system involved in multi-copper enzyme maturation permease subunit
VTGRVGAARTIIGYAFAESLRRRVFAVVIALTAAFVALYGLGAHFAFAEVEDLGLTGDALIDEQALTGGTIFGLAMFAVLFLGSVLAIFLTNGVVRGDADSGLLQPMVVRPLGRGTMLIARYLGAVVATTVYVLAIYAITVVITQVAGDWTPGHVVLPGLALAGAVAIVAALSVLVSVFLAATAQGIAVFMLFGGGLVAGLLGQIGDALSSRSLERISDAAEIALPFEALYQAGLHLITTDATGVTRAVIELGPFGGADEAGFGLVVFSAAYVSVVLALAVAAFARRDL